MLLRCLCLLLITLNVVAEPVAWDGPGQDGWVTLTSANFQIHYPAQGPYESLARRSLALAEQTHAELLPFFGKAPSHRTQLVLSDDQDYANGWATPFPFPQIRLYITPPFELSGLQDNGDWLSILIRHEYVHVLHMEMAGPVPEIGQAILGRFPLFFPHSLTSPMLIEGLAVYLETDYEAGTGRLASSWYQMQMQEEVRSGRFASLGHAAAATRDWPYGQYYLYGAFFMEYLARTYGEDALRRWLTLYSNEIIPWLNMDQVAWRAFGKSFPALWLDFRRAMERRFGGSSDLATGIIVADVVSARPDIMASHGDVLYRIVRNDEDRPELLRCTGVAHCLHLGDGTDITYLSAGTDSRLAGVRGTLHASGRYTGDLVVFDNGSWKSLTMGERLARIRWLPDGSGLIASSFIEGRSRLLLIRNDGKAEEFWRGGYGELVGEFDIDPSGSTIVASYKRPGSSWDLARMSVGSDGWTLLSSSPGSESYPRYLRDGRLLHVADYDGRYNLWFLNNDGSVSAVTDSDAASVAPEVTDSGCFWLQYTADGFRLAHNDCAAAAPVALAVQSAVGQLPQVAEAVTDSPEPYSPWRTLRPYFWLPYIDLGNVRSHFGFLTGGSDALGRHYYQMQVDVGTKERDVNINLMYLYERWQLLFDRDHSFYEFVEGDDDYTVVRDDQVQLNRLWLWSAWRDQFGVHGGVVHNETSFAALEPGVTADDRFYSTTSAGLALTLDLQSYGLQSPRAWGGKGNLVAEDFSLSDDAGGMHVQGQWHYGFDLSGRQVLTLRADGGYASDDSPRWLLGGLPPQEDELLFGRDQLSLYGYPEGVQRGYYFERQRLAYDAQIAAVNDNVGLWPFGLDDLQIGAYLDRGRAWSDDDSSTELYGAALELRLNLLIGYRVPVPFTMGVAKGFADEGELQVYGVFNATF